MRLGIHLDVKPATRKIETAIIAVAVKLPECRLFGHVPTSELPANRDLGYVKAGLASAEIPRKHAGALFSNLPWSLSVR
jgi:hypothetical protein